jgi:predicted alpha/beta superfamily hydrolase
MIKTALTILQIVFFQTLFSQHVIFITVDSLPPAPGGNELFIAGSFNNWNPADMPSRFLRKGTGQFYIELKIPDGTYEYKITRGSWNKVECSAGGTDIVNRILKVKADDSFIISIAGWKDQFKEKTVNHTAGPHVKIIDTAFRMPQLNRNRRVWIYLPEEYSNSELNLRFPVLYLHDGQNIFDDATSFAGEWGVDECIDSMKKKCIVVAIDNGAGNRLNEYCPYDFSLKSLGLSKADTLNKGDGAHYVDFLVKTLKPYIDNNYRTLGDKSNTFIAGSSMGGLISMYALLKYPKVFGGAGVFSPAFWVGPTIFDEIKKKGKKVNSHIYFYAGKQESESMVPDMLKAYDAMTAVSRSTMIKVINEEGKHNEFAWRKEFPLFYRWILK